MAQLEQRSPAEDEAPAPQTQLTTVLEEARPVSVGSSQAPTADDGFFEETRARGLAALREATAYLKTTPTKATPREAPAAVVAADDALQQLASLAPPEESFPCAEKYGTGQAARGRWCRSRQCSQFSRRASPTSAGCEREVGSDALVRRRLKFGSTLGSYDRRTPSSA